VSQLLTEYLRLKGGEEKIKCLMAGILITIQWAGKKAG
jgi:hypothetical protein